MESEGTSPGATVATKDKPTLVEGQKNEAQGVDGENKKGIVDKARRLGARLKEFSRDKFAGLKNLARGALNENSANRFDKQNKKDTIVHTAPPERPIRTTIHEGSTDQEHPQNEKKTEEGNRFAQLEDQLDAGEITPAEFNRQADALYGTTIPLSEGLLRRKEELETRYKSDEISLPERNNIAIGLAGEAARERNAKIFGDRVPTFDSSENASKISSGTNQEQSVVNSVGKSTPGVEENIPQNTAESPIVIPTDYKELFLFNKENFDPFSTLPPEQFKEIYGQSELGTTYKRYLEHKIQAEIDRQNPGVTFPDTVTGVVEGNPAFLQRVLLCETGEVVDANELAIAPFSEIAKKLGIRLPDSYSQHFR